MQCKSRKRKSDNNKRNAYFWKVNLVMCVNRFTFWYIRAIGEKNEHTHFIILRNSPADKVLRKVTVTKAIVLANRIWTNTTSHTITLLFVAVRLYSSLCEKFTTFDHNVFQNVYCISNVFKFKISWLKNLNSVCTFRCLFRRLWNLLKTIFIACLDKSKKSTMNRVKKIIDVLL